jgi:hypothetical protein
MAASGDRRFGGHGRNRVPGAPVDRQRAAGMWAPVGLNFSKSISNSSEHGNTEWMFSVAPKLLKPCMMLEFNMLNNLRIGSTSNSQ